MSPPSPKHDLVSDWLVARSQQWSFPENTHLSREPNSRRGGGGGHQGTYGNWCLLKVPIASGCSNTRPFYMTLNSLLG